MTYQIIITGPARNDIRQAVQWWGEHRYKDEAERWYNKIMPVIETLSRDPDRCPVSPEVDLLPTGLRQLHFGVSRKTLTGSLTLFSWVLTRIKRHLESERGQFKRPNWISRANSGVTCFQSLQASLIRCMPGEVSDGRLPIKQGN